MKKIKIVSQMTNREKQLLLVLGISLILFFVINLLLIPQTNRLNSLRDERSLYEEKLLETKRVLGEEKRILEEYEAMTREKEILTSMYFPSLDQSQIIYLLNDLTNSENLLTSDLTFTRPEVESIDGLDIMVMNISVPYEGSYQGILDLVEAIKVSPRKILMDSISMERERDNQLKGNVNLKLYSLEGLVETDREIIFIDKTSGGSKISPFKKYDDYYEDKKTLEDIEIVKENSVEVEAKIKDTNDKIDLNRKESILDFEKDNIHFIASQNLVKGLATRSTKSKIGKYSLRVEYDILAVEDENKGYLDLSENSLNLKYPPNSIGMWIYSYGYSPISIGLDFRGQMGERNQIAFTEGIGWSGWKYLQLTPPKDLALYPLEIDKIYLDMPKNREDFGVVLFDGLEAIYEKDGDGRPDIDYLFHLVKAKETLETISLKYYGSRSKVKEIMDLNDLKSNDVLLEGKILVIKKP